MNQLVNSWSVATRHMWDLPWDSHRYMVEELGGTHAKTMLYTRFVSFIQSIGRHSKFPVQFLLNLTKKNVMSVTGKNIRHILNETGQPDIFKVKISEVKKTVKLCELRREDKWKPEMIKELTNVKKGFFTLKADNDALLTNEEIQQIIDYVSTC